MADVRVAADYEEPVVAASLSALVEIFTVLGRYRDALVLIGGWAPYFILQRHQRPGNDFVHVGSIDADVAVNPELVDEETYATIVKLIEDRGYSQRKDKNGNPILFSFDKIIVQGGREFKVQVDFVTEPVGSGRKRHRTVQSDLRARMLRGCELVFRHNFPHRVTAMLPDNGEATVEIRVADLVGSLVTKGFALGERYKEKDAYDVFATLANFDGGPKDAAEYVKPYVAEPMVAEAFGKIGDAFGSRTSNGPSWVATFVGASGTERDRVQTDAYMVVSEFLRLLGARKT